MLCRVLLLARSPTTLSLFPLSFSLIFCFSYFLIPINSFAVAEFPYDFSFSYFLIIIFAIFVILSVSFSFSLSPINHSAPLFCYPSFFSRMISQLHFFPSYFFPFFFIFLIWCSDIYCVFQLFLSGAVQLKLKVFPSPFLSLHHLFA